MSDTMESNGSSSMAAVCGGCLALMDAGVPIKAPVAGIAMGMMEEGDKIAVLTDILGNEDHLGDMDFKVTGTPKGITALQMDIKVQGLTRKVLEDALDQAKQARLFLLEEMLKSAIGDDFYPGDMTPSEHWPGIAPGTRGILRRECARQGQRSAAVVTAASGA